MDTLLRYIASPAGRLARVAIGTALIGTGLTQGRKGLPLVAVGLLPLAMGATDSCLLAPLAGLPFEGPQLREILGPVAA